MRIIFILLALSALGVSAQEVQVGTNFNNVGTLREESKEWKTNEFPFKLVLMYRNGKTTINGNAMFFLIEGDKASGVAADEQKIVVGQGRNWAAFKYDFQAPGSYTITTFDREHTKLASSTITIEGPKKQEKQPEPPKIVEAKPEPKKEEPKVEKVEPKKAPITKEEILENAPEPVFVESVIKEELTEEEKETLLFESFYMAFGRSVQSGMLMGQNEKFKGVPGGVNLYGLFSNNEGFGTETVVVDIWFKPLGGKDYSEHIKELRVPIAKNATQANFPVNLRDRGSYKVSLYTGDEDAVWIGSSYVSIY
ncbi:MAG: hypothetical protein H6601_09695 [Flavobacteriales bacterium]|nr:hypothetical protein [Flavobacteriales bacterium]